MTENRDPRRRLPAIDRLLAVPALAPLIALYGRESVTVQARAVLDARRRELSSAKASSDSSVAGAADLAARVASRLKERFAPPLTRVLNATGVFLHTNLGRAPLPPAVAARLPALVDAYCDLEVDLESNSRGQRNRRLAALLTALSGAESALVVNNNAAALVLILGTLADGGEVLVSRGELVEIGGSFRLPEILAAAGCDLVEVGTTNRTRLEDYARAVGDKTKLLLKVFPSNYRIAGFVESVETAALAELAGRRGLPLVVDEGSGLLRPHGSPQLAGHPSLQELVAAGASIATGSADKLAGGPQAGMIVGRTSLIERCHRHPLYRALRPGRLTIAALEAVLRMHLAGVEMPLARMWPEPGEHRRRLERVGSEIGAEIVAADGYLGGGSGPEEPIPGEALLLPKGASLLDRLRLGEPPVVGYSREGRSILDLRTIDPTDDDDLIGAVLRARGQLSES